MYGKAMRWGQNHTDKYVFVGGEWMKVACSLGADMNCMAPEILPRGTKFDYNCRLTKAEEYASFLTG